MRMIVFFDLPTLTKTDRRNASRLRNFLLKDGKPINIIEELTVEYWFEKNDVKHHRNQNDVFNVKNLQKYLTIKEGDVSRKSFKRLHRWRYAPTSAYGNNEVHLHPYELRRISVAEALSIQSLPKEFHLPSNIPISLKFKMIGNGVPYLLGNFFILLSWCRLIIAYLIWKGSYNVSLDCFHAPRIIAYLIWKGSYNVQVDGKADGRIIAYLIWKGSYNAFEVYLQAYIIIAYLIWKGSYNN